MKRSLFLAAAAATLISVSAANAAVVFDSYSKAEAEGSTIGLSSTTSTPNTFMGTALVLAEGTTSLTGFDLFPVNGTAVNFTALQATVYIWDNVNLSGTVNSTTPAFSNLLASYQVTFTGTFSSGFYFPIVGAVSGIDPGVTITDPLALNDNLIGITINYKGSTNGTTFSNANNLTSLLVIGSTATDDPVTIGDTFNGYYRNASSETNGNFVSSLRSISTNPHTLALRVYGAVPEPAAMGLLAPAALMLGRRRKA